MVDRVRHGASFAATDADVFSVFCPPGASAAEICRRIEQAPWAAELALCALPQPALRSHVLGMVNRFYGVAYVQEIAAATVAALGVAMALLISILQRRRELGLLRTVGATPMQAVLVILAEALLMAVIGILFGLAMGAVLQWYVLRIVLLEETGFVFRVRFPWAHAAVVVAISTACAILAGLGPALRTVRHRISEAIAYE
jgi:putative ABC transport system permease protein